MFKSQATNRRERYKFHIYILFYFINKKDKGALLRQYIYITEFVYV